MTADTGWRALGNARMTAAAARVAGREIDRPGNAAVSGGVKIETEDPELSGISCPHRCVKCSLYTHRRLFWKVHVVFDSIAFRMTCTRTRLRIRVI